MQRGMRKWEIQFSRRFKTKTKAHAIMADLLEISGSEELKPFTIVYRLIVHSPCARKKFLRIILHRKNKNRIVPHRDSNSGSFPQKGERLTTRPCGVDHLIVIG